MTTETTSDESDSGIVPAGYVCAVLAWLLFPIGFGIAGVACGITAMVRGRYVNGAVIVTMAATGGFLNAWWGYFGYPWQHF